MIRKLTRLISESLGESLFDNAKVSPEARELFRKAEQDALATRHIRKEVNGLKEWKTIADNMKYTVTPPGTRNRVTGDKQEEWSATKDREGGARPIEAGRFYPKVNVGWILDFDQSIHNVNDYLKALVSDDDAVIVSLSGYNLVLSKFSHDLIPKFETGIVIIRRQNLERVAKEGHFTVVYWPKKTKEGAYQLQQFYKSIKPLPSEFFNIAKQSGFNG